MARSAYQEFFDNVPPELDPRLHGWGERRVPTNDDWCGTYADGTVKGSVRVLISGEVRVCFWGNDDTGYELDMPATIEAYQEWNCWLSGLSYIDIVTLISMGFRPA